MIPTYGYLGDAYAHEAITVAATAIGPTEATYQVAGSPGPVGCLVTTETAEVRYRLDGSDPTSTTGHVLPAGSEKFFPGPNVSSLKLIRTGATSATVRVTYFRG